MLTSLQLQQTVQLGLSLYEHKSLYDRPIIFHVKRVVQRAIAKGYNNEIVALCWLHDYHHVASGGYARDVVFFLEDIDKKLAKELEILNPQNYTSLRVHLNAVEQSLYPRIVKSLCIADELIDMPPGDDRNTYLEYLGKYLEKVDGYNIQPHTSVPLLGN
jgi:hypothetical protein